MTHPYEPAAQIADRAIADTQARIDAAVLAERQACLAKISAAAVMQRNLATTSTNCRLEYEHAAIQLENLASTIRARATNPDIAAAGSNSPAPCTTSLPGAGGDKDPVELLRQRVTVLEYALLDVAKQARPLREWGGNVVQVIIAARKNGWDGTGK